MIKYSDHQIKFLASKDGSVSQCVHPWCEAGKQPVRFQGSLSDMHDGLQDHQVQLGTVGSQTWKFPIMDLCCFLGVTFDVWLTVKTWNSQVSNTLCVVLNRTTGTGDPVVPLLLNSATGEFSALWMSYVSCYSCNVCLCQSWGCWIYVVSWYSVMWLGWQCNSFSTNWVLDAFWEGSADHCRYKMLYIQYVYMSGLDSIPLYIMMLQFRPVYIIYLGILGHCGQCCQNTEQDCFMTVCRTFASIWQKAPWNEIIWWDKHFLFKNNRISWISY